MPLSIHSFPKAIIHIDGDAFFASCESAVNPSLRGKPLITGKERGIVASLSYEAKRRGVKRGMIVSEARKVCPEVIVMPSDYETYSLFSKRMFAIVRRYTSAVEEYSIDECFADITGMRRPLRMSYEHIAARIKKELEAELGMTFSIGLAPNKSLAKLGSKWKKPSGLTIIPGHAAHLFLKETPVGRLWGIGSQTTAYLNTLGVKTAHELALKPKWWVEGKLSKPYREIWEELRGGFVLPLNLEEKHDYQSISKTKTFTPPSTDPAFIFSQLSKNIENACIKARRHGLATKRIFYFLKTQEFRHHGIELSLTAGTAFPNEIISAARDTFLKVYRPRVPYRSTGVVLMDLAADTGVQPDLFSSSTRLEKWEKVYEAVDAIDEKFGKHTVFLGSTFTALKNKAHLNERGDVPEREGNVFKGERGRQRLNIPMLGNVS